MMPIPLLIILLGLTTACSSTLQAKPQHQTQRFEEHVKEGFVAEAVVPHVHPRTKVNWSAYDKVYLRPVVISDGFSLELSPDEKGKLSELASSFYDMLSQKLSQEYVLVDRATPGSMVIAVAITNAQRSWVAPAVLSKVSWQLQLLNSVLTYFRGKPAFAGEVTMEFTVHDAQTGALLLAGTDRRVGGQNLFNKEVFNSWGDVQNSFEFWAEQSAYQLCVARQGTNCVQPKA